MKDWRLFLASSKKNHFQQTELRNLFRPMRRSSRTFEEVGVGTKLSETPLVICCTSVSTLVVLYDLGEVGQATLGSPYARAVVPTILVANIQ